MYTDSGEHPLSVAFVGNCLPRKCGIATFTFDLAEAFRKQIGGNVSIVAMNDRPEGYEYPERVVLTVDADKREEYRRAAHFLNRSWVDVVSLQHEFGIFGGEWGSYVVEMLRTLRMPVVVTCHSVPSNPDPKQRDVLSAIVDQATHLVVMHPIGIDLLENLYGARRSRISYIQHGIHDSPFLDTVRDKTRFGVRGHVLLTFGLINRNKGIEYMIDAMPEIVRRYPDTTYVVLGATHPVVVRHEGESYRRSLGRRAEELGVEKHVLFLNRFVSLSDLLGYLADTDIFVAPYLALDQVTSGALAYASGAGKAVVATPFFHARELLSGGRGKLVPPMDAGALAETVVGLLDDEAATDSMRRAAYRYCRTMVWDVTARRYAALFDAALTPLPQ